MVRMLSQRRFLRGPWRAFIFSLAISTALTLASPSAAEQFVSEDEAATAREECLQQIKVECLLVLALSLPPEEPSYYDGFSDYSGGNLNILRRLGYTEKANALAKTLPVSPESLMAEDKFEAAADLFVKNQQNVIYEHWSADREAILMIAKEHIRRGDVETAIKSVFPGDDAYGTPEAYLTRLVGFALNQYDLDVAEQIAYAIPSRDRPGLYGGRGGPRDGELNKLVKYLVDRGQLDRATKISGDIISLPFFCEAKTSLALAHYAAGETSLALDILQATYNSLHSAEGRTRHIALCALGIAGLQLELGAQGMARRSIELVEEKLRIEIDESGSPRPIPEVYVVDFSRVAILQELLGNQQQAEVALEVARDFFKKIERRHPNFQVEFWLTYGVELVVNNVPENFDISPILDLISIEENTRVFFSDAPVVFGEELAKYGDFKTANQIAEHISANPENLFSAYIIKDKILEQLALRGDVAAAQEIAESLGPPHEKYAYEKGQRWVARAAFFSGDTALARQILMRQMLAGPAEPRQLMDIQKMLGFEEDLRQSQQLHFERSLNLPEDKIRSELLYLASEIEE